MISETQDCRSAALQGRLAFLDAGSGNAALHLYSAPRPATAQDPITSSDLLATIGLAKPCGEVANGVLTLASLEPGLIVQTGAVAWVRVTNGSGATAFDMGVGPVGSGAECELSTADLLAGGLVMLISAVLD